MYFVLCIVNNSFAIFAANIRWNKILQKNMRTSMSAFRLALLISLFLVIGTKPMMAQRFAVKTNSLTWATLSPNLGAEFIVSNKVSIDLSTTFNPFNFKDYSLRFVLVQAEAKYWFGRPFSKHYVGALGLFDNNNFKFKDDYLKGDVYGGGFTYGYAWILSDHWTMDASIGLGVVHYRQFKRKEDESYTASPNKVGTSIAPIKLGLTFSYILK